MKKQMWLISAFVLSTFLFYNSALHAGTAYIESNGRQWLQVSDTLGLAWSDVNAICNSQTGELTGSAGGIDLSGWTWADVAAVNLLFREISNGAGFPDSTPQEYEILDAAWGPSSIDIDGNGSDSGYFHVTYINTSSSEYTVYGWTRDKEPGSEVDAYVGRITDSPTYDKLQTDDLSGIFQTRVDITGFWLYQDQTTSVPVPGALWLLGSGLTILAALRRRK
ncbi:MAG: VPLPA-CTERM sorting domain-containing protein [Proteobacteria bacterium]|nr:VPLPA-CTERM sorting domain-containing protein [Pseudomonadota bacterium]MBU1386855.1 VPLPA-CTERM sorting domain-containing protein [Pseudomonadota bacterium]MBU1541422.1 VPLPA-CTERM sorting domain-containing protein [Pseudomonadota bacterium]MBU2483084.1 VPLPA-CTERM sorting domain-containing protein [Pseudomonadota bacterium]